MLRKRIKFGTLAGLAVVAIGLGAPARAQNPTMANPATNVPPADVRARMWAATARYVYTDDPALATLRPQLLQTIDSSSVKAFGRSLDKVVQLERKAIPKQAHTLKLLGDFKIVSAKNEPAAALATTLATTLLDNNPSRQGKATFLQLRNTLHALAFPGAPGPVAAAPVAAPVAAPDSAAAVPVQAAAPASAATITPTSSTSMLLTYLALALSVISLLVSLLKGRGSRSGHRHHSHSAPALSTLTDEMRTEIRTMLQREVGKLPGARPAPDAPTKPAQSVKTTLAKAAAPQPAPVAVPAPPPPVASPAPAEPAPIVEESPAGYQPEPVAAPPTRTLYANQQPIDGFFKRDMLAEAPASYSIFELTMAADAPDQAQFVVASNPAGHAGYIGSHQNILGGACEYPFPKGSVSRIVTDAPGQAQRTASGDWQITRKAQVHFE
ncbi:hypothetical protein [Hymenobacter cheonanensis]|uniref:hypothetical protein n=1 Tax=Hymenobacter sp. CA2-7 TaxID=3063993 RepID=UPI002712A7C5|nr:hypothetical protein [Hymenobacter sp. CA2-7]MDO7886126.1 hypothetical protein [Hymenobacter sp. CA2-7]